MRRTAVAIIALILSVKAVRADDSMPKSVVDAVKAATVFVKVKTAGGGCSGSGFVVKTDKEAAYIVTNHHVIEPKLVEMLLVPDARSPGPRRSIGPHHTPSASLLPPGYTPHYIVHSFKNAAVTVVFSSGTKDERAMKAEVLSADPERDLALLKVSGVTGSSEPQGASKYPEPIDCLHELELTETMPVCTFGFPFGEMMAIAKGSPAITVGKASISSLRRDETGELALVQIDGALNPGNSGGPMVDTQGRLVGVAVATIRNSSGIGLAIPAREVSRMMQGRLGKVYVHASRDDNGAMTIHVEAALIDPFHKIKSVSLHYLDASHIADKPNPNEPLKALSGCRTLPLKIEDQSAVGQVSLKRGVSEVTLLHQAVCVNGGGQRVVANSVVETIKPDGDEVTVQLDKEPSSDRPVPATEPPTSERPSAPRAGSKSSRTARTGPQRPTENLDILLADLKSRETGRHMRALMQLKEMKPREPHPEVAQALETVLLEDGNVNMRVLACFALKNWGTADNLPALKKALSDREPPVRVWAKDTIKAIESDPEK